MNTIAIIVMLGRGRMCISQLLDGIQSLHQFFGNLVLGVLQSFSLMRWPSCPLHRVIGTSSILVIFMLLYRHYILEREKKNNIDKRSKANSLWAKSLSGPCISMASEIVTYLFLQQTENCENYCSIKYAPSRGNCKPQNWRKFTAYTTTTGNVVLLFSSLNNSEHAVSTRRRVLFQCHCQQWNIYCSN